MARATIDEAAVDELIAELASQYQRGPAQTVRQRMQSNSPVLSGLMRFLHRVDLPVKRADGWHIVFRTEARSREGYPYPIAVHNGRGEVRPRRAKALRWVSRSGAVVFAKRSGPSRPNPWMWRTFVQIGFRDIRRPYSQRGVRR